MDQISCTNLYMCVLNCLCYKGHQLIRSCLLLCWCYVIEIKSTITWCTCAISTIYTVDCVLQLPVFPLWIFFVTFRLYKVNLINFIRRLSWVQVQLWYSVTSSFLGLIVSPIEILAIFKHLFCCCNWSYSYVSLLYWSLPSFWNICSWLLQGRKPYCCCKKEFTRDIILLFKGNMSHGPLISVLSWEWFRRHQHQW
jgi:hypothetical protein